MKKLLGRKQIAEQVKFLSCLINEWRAVHSQGGNYVVVVVLNGAAMFASDLIRQLDRPLEIETEFIRVSSYGSGTTSSGNMTWKMPLERSIQGKDVLIVDDILDTGLTLTAVSDVLHAAGPRTLQTCVLLRKYGIMGQTFNADYVGFTIPNKFVVGYGLDCDGRYRNLPYVGVLESEL